MFPGYLSRDIVDLNKKPENISTLDE